MKRTLSLVLALVMILGTFTTVFAAEEVTALDLAAEVLEREGVLKGDGDDLMLEKNLLRRDMVVLVSRLMKAEDVAEDFPAEDLTFEDITDPHYNGYLAWSVANGIIEGHDEKTFGFNESVTVQDFAVVLLRVLGYEVTGHEPWKAAFADAKKLGLLDNVEVTEKDEVVRGVMAVMTFNALGTKMNDSDVTLAEFLGIEMPVVEVTELEIVEVYAENLLEVEVELSSADLAKADLENADNYKILGFVVENAELEDNNVRLTLNKALDNEKSTYELLVRGLDKELNGRYDFKVRDNIVPEVVEVEVLGEYGIKVTTTEPIKEARERSFLLDGKNVAMVVEQYGRDIILTPYHNVSFVEGDVVLTVGSLNDYAGFKSSSVDFDIVIEKNEEAPVAVGAELRNKTMTVEFDKDVYEKSVKSGSTGNAYFEVGRSKIYATNAKKVDTNVVEYTFGSDFSRRADLVVKGVQNHSKVAMEEASVDVVEIKDNLEPEVIDYDVYFLDGENVEVVLTFDKDLDAKKDDNNEYLYGTFKLFEEEVKTANNVTKDEDYYTINKNVVTIYLNELEAEEKYVLEVENFRDGSGNKMYVYYVDFAVPAELDTSVVTNIVTYWNDEEIEIRFNNPVDRYVAEVGSNYVFTLDNGRRVDLRDVNGSVIVERDGKTATLVVPGLNNREYDLITVAELKDINGNRIITENHELDTLFDGLVNRANTRIAEAGANYADEVLAVNNAKAIDDNRYADALEEAVIALETKLNNAETAAKRVAKTALENTIKIAENLYKVNANKPVLAVDLNNAKVVLADSDSTSVDLDIAKVALQAAINSISQGEVDAALVLYNDALIAVDEADYTIASWAAYQVIVDANEVDEDNSLAEVEAATSAITAAQADLVEVANLTAYTTASTEKIEAEYTVASWAVYNHILGQNVVTAQNTQAEVDAATGNIIAAQADLVVDKAALGTAITEAEAAIVEVSVDGSDVLPANKWTAQADLDTFEAAIDVAQGILDDADATPAEVADAITVLDAAVIVYVAAQADGTQI